MTPRAMILAAGLGTRLKPLTDHTPKALLEYMGKPMLEHVVNKLSDAGIRQVIINVHHLSDQIVEFVRSNNNFGMDIRFSDESGELLDTGGGIYNARSFFEGHGSFIVYNIDILSDIDLKALYKTHIDDNRLATLAVKQRVTSRNFLVNEAGLLCGWKNNQSGETIYTREKEDLKATAFSGIHVISERIFPLIGKKGPFSITQAYLELSKDHPIHVYDHSGDQWIDMAHPDNFPGLLK